MEKSCHYCRLGKKNNYGYCPKSRQDCGDDYSGFEPIEKKCRFCKKSKDNNGTGKYCEVAAGKCGLDFEYFEPIEKEPAMKADDYEILRDCTLESLVDDGKCFEAVKFYRDNFKGYYIGQTNKKLKDLFDLHPTDVVENVIKYLIENKYIKKVAREPKAGEVWKNKFGKYKIFGVGKSGYNFDHKCIYTEESGNMYDAREYVCDANDLLKHLTGE